MKKVTRNLNREDHKRILFVYKWWELERGEEGRERD